MGPNWAFKNEQNLETHKREKKIFQIKRKQHEQRHLEGKIGQRSVRRLKGNWSAYWKGT